MFISWPALAATYSPSHRRTQSAARKRAIWSLEFVRFRQSLHPRLAIYSQLRTCLASACDLDFRESAAQKPFDARCHG